MLETDGPLINLGQRLKRLLPPSLANLIGFFEETEEYAFFIDLVREYLPEREQEILHEPDPAARMATFASHFRDRYFPLVEMFDESYRDLVWRIPVDVTGIGYDDYHETENWRDGLQLMTYLVESPYEGEGHAALAELCAQLVPRELLRRVPAGGFAHQELCDLLVDTRFEGLAHWGGVLFSDTGNFFLDISSQEFWEGTGPEWNRDEVDGITADWLEAERINDDIYKLCEWLEQDKPARFEELLNFVLERTTNE